MLKKRIIPLELLKNDRLVKSCNFSEHRDVGHPIKSSKVYSDQDADELILLNIGDGDLEFDNLVRVVGKLAFECFVPLSAGGGIRKFGDAEKLFEAGADRVVLNSACYSTPLLIKEIADEYGGQSVVVGIDVKFTNGRYLLYSNSGVIETGLTLDDHIKTVINLGAGEILIQSIDRDGMMQGLDLILLTQVLSFSSIPVIIAGGTGSFMDLKSAFDLGVDAVACGSLFNFGDNNPLRAKSFLKNYGIPLKIL